MPLNNQTKRFFLKNSYYLGEATKNEWYLCIYVTAKKPKNQNMPKRLANQI